MLPGVGLSEMILIAVLALVLVGPKDLPLMMRKFGRMTGRVRQLAFEFRQSFDELGRQAELDELRREVADLKKQTGLEDLKNDLSKENAALQSEVSANYDASNKPKSRAEALEQYQKEHGPPEGGADTAETEAGAEAGAEEGADAPAAPADGAAPTPEPADAAEAQTAETESAETDGAGTDKAKQDSAA